MGLLVFESTTVIEYLTTEACFTLNATVFETNKDLLVGGKELKKGKYSLWTVPNQQSWTVVFNGTIPNWGIDVLNNGEAARDPANDVLIVELPVATTEKEFVQFTIYIEKADEMVEMVLAWDKTLVSVPIYFRASLKTSI